MVLLRFTCDTRKLLQVTVGANPNSQRNDTIILGQLGCLLCGLRIVGKPISDH